MSDADLMIVVKICAWAAGLGLFICFIAIFLDERRRKNELADKR